MCSAGRSRTYHHHSPAESSAAGAVSMNEARQPNRPISHAISGPAAAAPNVAPKFWSAFGKAHPETGNQWQVVPPPMIGKSGAWAAPIRNRRVISARTTAVAEPAAVPGTNATSRLSTPQSAARIVSARRAPITSPRRPPGNWKIA